jgi:hypothetical protein
VILHQEEEPISHRKRKRRNQGLTFREENRQKKIRGEEYEVYRKLYGRYQKVKCPPKKPRKYCNQACRGKSCNLFTPEKLDEISLNVRSYHSTKGSRNAFIRENVEEYEVKRRKASQNIRTRKSSYKYYLTLSKEDGLQVKAEVCKKTFLQVTGFREQLTRKNAVSTVGEVKKRQRGMGGARGETYDTDKEFLVSFFRNIAKAPSHYCRINSSVIYLDTVFKTKKQLFKFYANEARAAGLVPFKKTAFNDYMDDKNYSLVRPKKDLCDICYAYKQGNYPEEQWVHHMALKQAALDAKDIDKTTTPDTTLVFCEDTEALLVSPHNRTSAMFYRTKLNVHNLTWYDLKTRDVLNYLWTEVEGGLTASIFTSIHVDRLEKLLEEHPRVTEIIVWSDGCQYQNKNAVEATALRRFASKNGVTVVWKYLQVGHTFMEGDSAHSAIEAKRKQQDVNSPHDYISIIKHARERKPAPSHFL